jgi:hypothetical protein
MQRLFSAFPGSWPAAGLLLLRLGAAYSCVLELAHGVAPALRASINAAGFLTAPFLLIGLWTPVAGSLQALMSVAAALLPGSQNGEYLLHAVLGASLVLLGPGAWSVDARLFGRKRIDITPRPADPG